MTTSPPAKVVAVCMLLAALAGFSAGNISGLNVEPARFVVDNFGLPLFFVLLGIELKHEFVNGAFTNRRLILVPTLAAVFGVALPALGYLAVTWATPVSRGWLIPTATDASIALAVYAVFGKGLPSAARAFLLAVAIIDDCIGILLLGTAFSAPNNPPMIAATILGMALIWWLARGGFVSWKLWLSAGLLVGVLYCAAESGIQPTIVGALLGFLAAPDAAKKLHRKLIRPVSLGVIPAFVFLGCLISTPVSNALFNSVLAGVLLRVPLKILGIALGAIVGMRLSGPLPQLRIHHIWLIAPLGGIGFTVSIFTAGLAFPVQSNWYVSAVLGTILATLLSAAISAVALSKLANRDKSL